MAAFVNGERVDEASALAHAAALLDRARLAVVGGLFTDIAGAEAAIALAQRLGGVIDHAAGEALSRSGRMMRQRGGDPASFGEVRNRSDLVVVVGSAPLERPDLLREFFPAKAGLPRPGDKPRELVLIGTHRTDVPADVPIARLTPNVDLATTIAVLAARVAGRPAGEAGDELERVAERLRGASYAVFVYSPAELDEPVIQTILETVRQLSVKTRASAYSLPAPGNGEGVTLCSAWTCGLPLRTSFAGDVPKQDGWLFAADRLIESGEADALVWIDALKDESAQAPKGVPTILLASEPESHGKADIVFEVACAGRDHDAALYFPALSGIGLVKAGTQKTDAPTVAETLQRIAKRIAGEEARSC